MQRYSALLPAALIPVVTIMALGAAALAPRQGQALMARFGDDGAALAGAVAAGASPIALPGDGRVVVPAAPGLAERLRAAGARLVTALPAAFGCTPLPQEPRR